MSKEQKPLAGAIMLGIANPLVRRAMTDEFRQRWAEEVIIVQDWKMMIETLSQQAIAILVLDDVLFERRTAPVIRDIRNGLLHQHPFPLVIALAHEQQEQQLRELIDSGPDAVVLTPVSITNLFSKIDRLAAGRKPFVVTRDYVGPDRRSAPREGVGAPRVIEAPNPIGAVAGDALFQSSLQALSAAKVECGLDALAFALKSDNAMDFGSVIPAIEQLARSTPKAEIRAAAEDLCDALRAAVIEDIRRYARALLAAARG